MKPIILLLIVLLSTGCSINKNYESVLFLEDLSAGSEPSRLKDKTSQPERNLINYNVDGRRYQGDLYKPVKPTALAKIVLVPGIAEQGKDDPRLINFAYTLARARFLVLVPEISSLRELKVKTSDSRTIAETFRYLINDDLIPDARAGLMAFSYAIGPTVHAAMHTSIRNEVDFLLSVGGYYDLNQVLTFFTTGNYLKDGKWQYLTPNDYGKWVFISSNLERIQNSRDREIFQQMAKRKLADTNATIDDLITDLGSEGQALYAFINNKDPEQTPKLIENLSTQIKQDLDTLNIANKDLNKLKAHLILIHGKNDDIIPYSESIALANNLPSDQVELFIVAGISHVDIKPGLLDKWRLLKTANAILKQRERTK